MKSRRPQSKKSKGNLRADAKISGNRLWLFRIAALLLPIVLLCILEICLRLEGYGYDPHFFREIKIGGEDYYVQNDDFSLNFFPPETARNPGPVRFLTRKPPGVFRVFVFGESAAMGDPEPAFGPARYTEVLLTDRFPNTKFEIINVAFTAIDSHVILPIARECARHEGDLWIIYMGNNEMVGPYGAATVFGAQAPPLAYARLMTGVRRTRTGQLLAAIANHHRGTKQTSWGGMQMFLQNQIAPEDPRRSTVYRNYRKNLDDILDAGTSSGAKVLLNEVAVNLADCPPFASMENSNLPPAACAQFEELLAEGREKQAQGNVSAATEIFSSAAKLDPTCADLQFHIGQCLLAQNNFPAAREHLQSACDDDALPFRADSQVNAAIAEAAKKYPGKNLVLFDAPTALANSVTGICDSKTFYEHVHFDFDGSYRLGLAWAKQIEPLLPATISRNAQTNVWATQDACNERLGLSDWNRALVLEHMATRMQEPPFSTQPDNAERMSRLQTLAVELRARMNSEAAARAKGNFLKQLNAAPDDFLLRENFALFLQSTGDLPGAVSEWRRIHELIPQDYLAYFQIGKMLGGERQWDEAETSLRQALKMHPTLTEGWIELGNVLASQGKFTEALDNYSHARQQRPQDPQTIFRMAKVLAQLDRHSEAMQCYRGAIQLNPSNWEPHYELAGELDAANQLDGARSEFAEAVRLNPNYSRAHFNYGVMLAKEGLLAEARREFAETLRLEPNYKNAQDGLEKIQILLQRSASK